MSVCTSLHVFQLMSTMYSLQWLFIRKSSYAYSILLKNKIRRSLENCLSVSDTGTSQKMELEVACGCEEGRSYSRKSRSGR